MLEPILWTWLAGINLLTFAAFRFDKLRAASGGPRVRERDLLLLVAMGGTIGGWLGRRIFRHKTRKESFSMAFFLIVAAQALLLVLADQFLKA